MSGDDLGRAMSAIERVLEADERVLAEPEAMVKVSELADSSVNILVRAWTPAADFLVTKLDLTRQIKEKLDAEGITIPFP